jgi:hypothetical protein
MPNWIINDFVELNIETTLAKLNETIFSLQTAGV